MTSPARADLAGKTEIVVHPPDPNFRPVPTPDMIRDAYRLELMDQLPNLKAIADGTALVPVMTKLGPIDMPPDHGDRVRAIATIGKFAAVEKLTIETPPPSSQDTETGEQVMQRVTAMMGRALLAAPQAARLAVIRQLEEADSGIV